MAAVKLSGTTLINEVNQTAVPAGTLAWWWLGQNGFIFKGGDTVLYLDAYLSPSPKRQTPPVLKPEEATNASLVLCTHDHTDHIDPDAVPGMAKASPQAPFVAPRTAAERMLSLGVAKEQLRTMNAGERLQIAGATIVAVKSKHEFFGEHPQLGFPFLGFVVEMNGVRFYHAGDTVPYDGLIATLRSLQPHIMFLPINGRDAVRYRANCIGNCTFQEAVDLAGEVKPVMAVPMHYDMFAHNAEDPAKFVDYLNAKYPGIQTWVGAAGEKVEFK